MEGSEHVMAGQGKVCKCPHHKAVPIIVILMGLDFLLGSLNVLTGSFVSVSWPILLIAIGVVKMANCNCCGR